MYSILQTSFSSWLSINGVRLDWPELPILQWTTKLDQFVDRCLEEGRKQQWTILWIINVYPVLYSKDEKKRREQTCTYIDIRFHLFHKYKTLTSTNINNCHTETGSNVPRVILQTYFIVVLVWITPSSC